MNTIINNLKYKKPKFKDHRCIRCGSRCDTKYKTTCGVRYCSNQCFESDFGHHLLCNHHYNDGVTKDDLDISFMIRLRTLLLRMLRLTDNIISITYNKHKNNIDPSCVIIGLCTKNNIVVYTPIHLYPKSKSMRCYICCKYYNTKRKRPGYAITFNESNMGILRCDDCNDKDYKLCQSEACSCFMYPCILSYVAEKIIIFKEFITIMDYPMDLYKYILSVAVNLT